MRIDKFFAEKFGSRTKAAEAVKKGLVLVNGKLVSPSYEISQTDKFEFIEAEESFVSAGGYKLSKAFKDFNYSPKNKIFADIGASNGGFTDCLFKNGAKKVYCIDVGESQLDKSLFKNDVVVIDNYNARYLNKSIFFDELDGVVIDVSFISLTYILGAVSSVLQYKSYVFALIKPQFECENKCVGKNGIVKDGAVHKKVITKIYDFAVQCGLIPINLTLAPEITGKNKEFIIQLYKSDEIKANNLNNLLKSVNL